MWCKQKYFLLSFKDIPDVVEFILKKKWDEILEHPQDRASILECMEEMADLVRNNRKVMFNVYRSVKKDTFLFYMNEISNYIIMEYFRKMQISLILMREKSGFWFNIISVCLWDFWWSGWIIIWNLILEKKCVRLPGFLKSTRSYMRYWTDQNRVKIPVVPDIIIAILLNVLSERSVIGNSFNFHIIQN